MCGNLNFVIFMSEKARKVGLNHFEWRKRCGNLDFIIFIGKTSSERWNLSFLMAEKDAENWTLSFLTQSFCRPEKNIFCGKVDLVIS